MAARGFLLLLLLLFVGLLVIWAETPSAREVKGICRLPVEVGPCLAIFPRWYHDWRKGRCIPFTYGGCGGNGNNFQTRQECERACGVRSGKCPIPQGPGICVEECRTDSNCGAGEKCCGNGCGHVCMKVTGGAQRD